MEAADIEARKEMANEEFKSRILLLEYGKKRIMPKPNPRVPRKERNIAIEIKADANPTSSSEYNLAATIQQTEPTTEVTKEFAIR